MILKTRQWESSAESEVGDSSKGSARSAPSFRRRFGLGTSQSSVGNTLPTDAPKMHRRVTAPDKLEGRRSAPDKMLDRLVGGESIELFNRVPHSAS